MSAQDRYTKIIESLVNGEEAKASELLHEAFVEKAREIYSDLVEQDDIVEEDVSDEELEEAIRDEESGDFIDDIEDIASDEDEIEAEEMFGEDDDEEEMDAELELAGDDEAGAEEGDMDGVEDAMMNVEDALADLKAEFAAIMGGDSEEPADDMDMEMDGEEPEMEEESYAFESDESDEEELDEEAEEELEEEAEELEEAADLKKVGADKKIHPIDMPAGDDGKASPVAGKNDMGGETIKTGAKGSEGSSKGLSDEHAKDMGVTHPGDGAGLKPENRGHGAEKKGAAPAKPGTDSLINKAPK